MGIFDFFSPDDAQKAAQDQISALNKGYGQLSDNFSQGRSALTTSLANSVAPFQTNLTTGQAGQSAYADATGANGAAGTQRAVNNFQTSPGYQFDVNQTVQNILRGQEATGQAASGATNSDIATQVSGLANNQWQNYIQNLQPFLNTSNAAATGIAGANQNFGNQTNQSFTTQGNAAYGNQAAIGNAQAQSDMAPYNASANLFNFGSNLVKNLAGFAGQKSA